MKIYTLENKNEILAILTHSDNMNYREFKRICSEVNEEAPFLLDTSKPPQASTTLNP